MTGREMLLMGNFNYMSQTTLSDGSIEIILSKRGESVRYHLVVKNLYRADELVLVDEVLNARQEQQKGVTL